MKMSNYIVRVFCDDCGEYKYTTQLAVDPDWIPGGCESHAIRDFVIEEADEVE